MLLQTFPEKATQRDRVSTRVRQGYGGKWMWMWNNFFILQTHLLGSSCNCQKVCVCVYTCASLCGKSNF